MACETHSQPLYLFSGNKYCGWSAGFIYAGYHYNYGYNRNSDYCG